MKSIQIYEFQLKIIQEALRLTQNIYCKGKTTGETCFDRQVRQAKKYTDNALEGKIDERVDYV